MDPIIVDNLLVSVYYIGSILKYRYLDYEHKYLYFKSCHYKFYYLQNIIEVILYK